jgi:hypothetical protein
MGTQMNVICFEEDTDMPSYGRRKGNLLEERQKGGAI